MNCIFCHKDSSTSNSVEHIIPESLGNVSHTLPKGYVCDECNNYFAVKIEKELLEQPYFVSLRFRNEIPTKKNKLVKQKMIFPGAMKMAEVVIQNTEKGLIASFDDDELFQRIKSGKCNKMIAPYLPILEYPNRLMSRFLAKCAFEYMLYNMVEHNYYLCTQEVLKQKSIEPLRLYARYGKGTEWQYHQRRIYPEGALFIDNESLNPYEIIHEMKLFVKEKVDMGNGITCAEIYYILVINGIEYSLCFTDPEISSYKQWLSDNNHRSPLNDENEKILRQGLSYVNPLLIK